jgi:hypothetical protein
LGFFLAAGGVILKKSSPTRALKRVVQLEGVSMPEPKAHNDFEFLKRDHVTFCMFEGKLCMELAKNGSASQALVDAYKAAARSAAKAIIVCEGQSFLIMFEDQARELIAKVKQRCAQLQIQL